MPSAIELEEQPHVVLYAIKVAVANAHLTWHDFGERLEKRGFGRRRLRDLYCALAQRDRVLFRLRNRKLVKMITDVTGYGENVIAPPVEIVIVPTTNRVKRFILRPGGMYADEDGMALFGHWKKNAEGKIVIVNARNEELILEPRPPAGGKKRKPFAKTEEVE